MGTHSKLVQLSGMQGGKSTGKRCDCSTRWGLASDKCVALMEKVRQACFYMVFARAFSASEILSRGRISAAPQWASGSHMLH